VQLNHLCLAARNRQRSQDFYARYFGFRFDEATPPEEGTIPLQTWTSSS
jgi:catechol 2,3-dioxygenase-like lactoylglutathione lyase family enzyme